jgi:hypothetical protein
MSEGGRGAACGTSRAWPRRSSSRGGGGVVTAAGRRSTGSAAGGAGALSLRWGGPWNQLCLQAAHLTCRPDAPIALSGTT